MMIRWLWWWEMDAVRGFQKQAQTHKHDVTCACVPTYQVCCIFSKFFSSDQSVTCVYVIGAPPKSSLNGLCNFTLARQEDCPRRVDTWPTIRALYILLNLPVQPPPSTPHTLFSRQHKSSCLNDWQIARRLSRRHVLCLLSSFDLASSYFYSFLFVRWLALIRRIQRESEREIFKKLGSIRRILFLDPIWPNKTNQFLAR